MCPWKFLLWMLLLIPGPVSLYVVTSDVTQFYESLSTEGKRLFFQYQLAKVVKNESDTSQLTGRNEDKSDLVSDLNPEIPSDYLQKFQDFDKNISPGMPYAMYNYMRDYYHFSHRDICEFIMARTCFACNLWGQCFDLCDGSIFCCV